MKIDFNELSGKKKEIYEDLWKDNPFSADVVLSGKKDYSYEFFNAMQVTSDSLSDIFELNDKSLFREKFAQVCSGSGDEIKKITTLHSSSLCALLFFYNVTENNQLSFHGSELSDIVFSDSIFEFKNKVIRSPSNVDVVLIGKNKKSNKSALLFLESKFSEYITGMTKANRKYEIGKSYIDKCDTKCIYQKEILDNFNITLDKTNTDKYYLIPSTDKYIEGIKQMVSHHVGIRNLITENFCDKNDDCSHKKITTALSEEHEIFLGEIMFDGFPTQKDILNSYSNDYKKIAQELNSNFPDCGVKVLNEPLYYSMFKKIDFNVDKKVHQYYKI